MDTLRALAERAIREISGGDIPADSPYDIDYAIETARDIINADLKVERLRRRGESDDRTPISQFICTYDGADEKGLDIEYTDDERRSYITTPDNFLSIERNKGVHAVKFWDKNSRRWVNMIPIHHTGVAQQTPGFSLEGKNFGYTIEGLRIYFTHDVRRKGITKVMLQLIVAAPQSGFTADDVIPMLPESKLRYVQTIKEAILNKFPQDRIADNSPNNRMIHQDPEKQN